ncbi:ABC transporter ATP-binding protein [Natrinema marinum]|uniref:ABC transporter ATP-binding protein n=1 Tax=Natrinema marinum TaxID=2961598 RepID=UPI0020C8635A|nr:ABC transporter ATP-binding protein [Natrinema marinum]
MSLLEIDDLSVSYGQSAVLNDIDLSLEAGSQTGLIGPNGAGKTTMLKAISGRKEYDGSITYRGTEVSELSTNELVDRGLVQVSEAGNLFGPMTVRENLELGAIAADDTETQLERVFDVFPRLEERSDQDANTLSGGEQQMLAIGRGLMADPDLLMVDEPTQGLAPVIVDDLSEAIDKLYDDLTLFIVEQNAFFVFEHTDYAYLLENGRIHRSGATADLRADQHIRDAYLGVD